MSGDLKPMPPGTAPTAWWRMLFSVNALGLGLLLFAASWSLLRVLTIRHREDAPGIKTVRIAHWQLESGYREALQSVIDEYNLMHQAEGVRVVQMPVAERVYAQWLTVNLISDTAPDLSEMGMSKLVSSSETIAKYFMPLGQEIVKPNPYNAPQYLDELQIQDDGIRDLLSNSPWRETMVDGMRGGYKADLQDYYSVATSFFTLRLFYNKTLLKEALGTEVPPRSLGQLFETCEKLRIWARANNRIFDPIAATKYNRDIFLNPYRVAITAGYANTVDTDLSGDLSSLENWAGFQAGKIKFSDPAMVAYWQIARRICAQFNPQFAAFDRDMAISDFAQGRAAFIAAGSWDAPSLFSTCRFETAIIDFPLPAPGEPYAEFGVLPPNEAASTGGASFGLAKTSKHSDLAIDFLRFLTSHKWNQRLNAKATWLPVTIGTVPAPKMVPFMPNPYGVSSSVGFTEGFDLEIKVTQSIDLFLSGEIPFDTFATTVETYMKDPAIGIDRIWVKALEKENDKTRNLERTISVNSFRELAGTGIAETPSRLRTTILDQNLTNNGGNTRLLYERQNHRPFGGAER